MKTLGSRSVAWGIKRLFDVIWYLLVLLAGVFFLVTLVNLIRGDFSDTKIDFQVRLEPDPELFRLSSQELHVESAELLKVQGQMRFPSPGGYLTLGYLSLTYLLLAMVMFAVYQLRAVFGTLVKEAPFVRANARRIRSIGLMLILGQLAGSVLRFGLSGQIHSAFVAEGWTLVPSPIFEPFSILFGLILIVIAEVFRIGADLKEEQDLTV